MSETSNFAGTSKRVLFFGRAKCAATEELLSKFFRYGFDVTFVKSHKRGEKLPEDIYLWEGEYIVCFRSLFIIPKRLYQLTFLILLFHQSKGVAYFLNSQT